MIQKNKMAIFIALLNYVLEKSYTYEGKNGIKKILFEQRFKLPINSHKTKENAVILACAIIGGMVGGVITSPGGPFLAAAGSGIGAGLGVIGPIAYDKIQTKKLEEIAILYAAYIPNEADAPIFSLFSSLIFTASLTAKKINIGAIDKRATPETKTIKIGKLAKKIDTKVETAVRENIEKIKKNPLELSEPLKSYLKNHISLEGNDTEARINQFWMAVLESYLEKNLSCRQQKLFFHKLRSLINTVEATIETCKNGLPPNPTSFDKYYMNLISNLHPNLSQASSRPISVNSSTSDYYSDEDTKLDSPLNARQTKAKTYVDKSTQTWSPKFYSVNTAHSTKTKENSPSQIIPLRSHLS